MGSTFTSEQFTETAGESLNLYVPVILPVVKTLAVSTIQSHSLMATSKHFTEGALGLQSVREGKNTKKQLPELTSQ